MDLAILERPHTSLDETDFLQFAQSSANGPVLQRALVVYLLRKWVDLNPIVLREKALQSNSMMILNKLLTEAAKVMSSDLFTAWKNLVCFQARSTPTIEFRQQLLHVLLTQKRRIHIRDYLAALNHTLSRRQALRDLETFPFIQIEGSKKARRYSLRKDFKLRS